MFVLHKLPCHSVLTFFGLGISTVTLASTELFLPRSTIELSVCNYTIMLAFSKSITVYDNNVIAWSCRAYDCNCKSIQTIHYAYVFLQGNVKC